MINSFSDFIYVADGTLDPEFCKNVIEKFEKDDRKKPGIMGRQEEQRVDTSIKDSIDLYISSLPEWEDEDKVLFNSLHEHHKLYLDKGKWRDIYRPGLGDLNDGCSFVVFIDRFIDHLLTLTFCDEVFRFNFIESM